MRGTCDRAHMPSSILVVLNISGSAIRDFVRVYCLHRIRDEGKGIALAT